MISSRHFIVEPVESHGVTRYRATLFGRKEVGYGQWPRDALADLERQLVASVVKGDGPLPG